MKIKINPKKYGVVYDWLCDNVGYPYGGDKWMQCGQGWEIHRHFLDDVAWVVKVDFRRIPAPTRTEFLLRFA